MALVSSGKYYVCAQTGHVVAGFKSEGEAREFLQRISPLNPNAGLKIDTTQKHNRKKSADKKNQHLYNKPETQVRALLFLSPRWEYRLVGQGAGLVTQILCVVDKKFIAQNQFTYRRQSIRCVRTRKVIYIEPI